MDAGRSALSAPAEKPDLVGLSGWLRPPAGLIPHKVHAHEIHVYEMHACEVHAYGTPVYQMHVSDMQPVTFPLS